MSKLSFRPRGGQTGIETTEQELIEFAQEIGEKACDNYIPLPDTEASIQKLRMLGCPHHDDPEYWEDDNGAHGWCCGHCGKVIQWG